MSKYPFKSFADETEIAYFVQAIRSVAARAIANMSAPSSHGAMTLRQELLLVCSIRIGGQESCPAYPGSAGENSPQTIMPVDARATNSLAPAMAISML